MEVHEKKIRELQRENTKLIIKTQSASTPTPAVDTTSMNTSTASTSPITASAENLNEDFDAAVNDSPYSEYNKTKEDMTAPFEETNFAMMFGSKPMAFASNESLETKILHNTQREKKTNISIEMFNEYIMKSLAVTKSPSFKEKRLVDVFEPLTQVRFSYTKLFEIMMMSLFLVSIIILCLKYIILPVVGKMTSTFIDQMGHIFNIDWMVYDTKPFSIIDIDWMN